MHDENEGKICETGIPCPATGLWQTVKQNPENFFFKKGEMLPLFEGANIAWVFIGKRKS